MKMTDETWSFKEKMIDEVDMATPNPIKNLCDYLKTYSTWGFKEKMNQYDWDGCTNTNICRDS